jgi:hypothetical protein
VKLVLGREVDEHLITMLWILYSPESYLKLIIDAGFTRAAYEELLVDATRRLAGDGGTPRARRP